MMEGYAISAGRKNDVSLARMPFVSVYVKTTSHLARDLARSRRLVLFQAVAHLLEKQYIHQECVYYIIALCIHF